jgi:alpha/beta superfamily hydrolase
MIRLGLLLSLLPALAIADGPAPGGTGFTERSVCGALKEPFTFWMWRRAAGSPNPDAARRLPNAEPISHRTRDGRELRGYRLAATAPGGKSRGAMLVAQGNAMLADQLLYSLAPFAAAGLDTYIFDYRGYGDSEGRPRLQAIIGDYAELHARHIAGAAGERLLYGISFGGIVLLNAIGAGATFDRAVIDSSPSRLSPHGCPPRFDPLAHLPADASRLMFVGGARDRVVPLADSGELFATARARGARIVLQQDFAHPFMDADPAVHRRRSELIEDFLAGRRESP